MRSIGFAGALLAVWLTAACGAWSTGARSAAGVWRAVLASPGGDLPFGLRIEEGDSGRLIAVVVNGEEVIPVETARMEGDRITLRFDHYDSEIVATMSADGGEMRGSWVRQAGKDRPSMIFLATRGPAPRFGAGSTAGASGGGTPDISGAWHVVFSDEEGASPARGEFRLEGDRLLGTFLTPTGDYRYLEGDYREGKLRLSCFDGGHAFLFHARLGADGALSGDFWSRGSYHATWKATRAAASEPRLPDPFTATTLRNASGRLAFSFPDLEGRPVSLADPRFAGKVVLVDIFGSWCPNCNDQAPLLADLHRKYRDRGLEVVGLAYEMTGEPTRDALFVKRYAERYGITFPLLLAGTSDKSEASLTLPDLSGVLAFPTLVFVGRDGKVAAIHTGFAGPATGKHFDELKAKYLELVESLL